MKIGLIVSNLLAVAYVGNACAVDWHNRPRPTSEPYISGDAFRARSDFIFDVTVKRFDPTKVVIGSTIFVDNKKLKEFFHLYHPRITKPYILITHNADDDTPGEFGQYLNDSKLYAWFARNIDRPQTNKLRAIPIGLANEHWQHHCCQIIDELRSGADRKRDYLVYCNIRVASWPAEREPVRLLFENQPFVLYEKERVNERAYLERIAQAKCTLSPRGNGLDCYRTWEALYLGCIPVIKTSTLDPIFEDLPVIIIEDWKQVTKKFLEGQYEKIKHGTYRLEKMYFDYWWNLIEQSQKQCRVENSVKSRFNFIKKHSYHA